MYNSFIWLFIFPIIFILPILTFSLNSWFSMWISMEMSTMSFIPLMIFFNKYNKEISIKYFIIQSLSSFLMLMSSNFPMYTFLENNFFNLNMMILNISLLIKLGMFPFHSWYINMMIFLSWKNCFMLSIWQKLIPLTLISYSKISKILIISICMSSMISFMGINQISIRLIFSYSSLNHLSWIILMIIINKTSWTLYFFMYSILSLSMIFILNMNNLFYINQIIMKKNYNNFLLSLISLSLMGLPPFWMFYMKWYIMYMYINEQNYWMYLFSLTSLLSFIFYLNFSFSLILFNKINNKMMISYKINLSPINMMLSTLILSMFNLWIINLSTN